MPREEYERDLKRLQDDVLIMASMVEDMMVNAVTALKKRDMAASQRLIKYDERINEKRFAVENTALTLIATQQPMARDLRVIAAVLEIVTELERIGDYAKGIARINLRIGEGALIKPLVDLPRMAQMAKSMLHQSLDAFVDRDVELARAIVEQDDEIDQLYNQVYRELLTLIMSNPTNIEHATLLLWAAHNLERAGDRAVNICERVVFTVTGEMVELSNTSE